MSDETKYLGKINCTMPTCGQPVPLFASKKGLAHFTCNECGCQTFTRNNRADRILRGLIIKPASSPAPTPPAAKPAPTKSANDEKPAAPAAGKPAAAPAVAGKRGLFGRG